MASPNVPQGSLNRLIASVSFDDFPELNVSVAYLGEGAMHMSLEGTATTNLPTLTGVVTSPEPYQMATLTIELLRTLPLADSFKSQAENSSLLGSYTARSDSTAQSPYAIVNASIDSVREQNWNGKTPGYVVTIKGQYNINSSLWQ